jgi:hypothetical protein
MSFDSQLKVLQKKRAKKAVLYSNLYKAARKENKSLEEIESIHCEASAEDEVLEFEIESLVTRELVRKAEHLFIPIPPRKDSLNWKESSLFENTKFLTPHGISKLRDSIREEEKKGREARMVIIDLCAKAVAMLTGLVGATIGLVSILSR